MDDLINNNFGSIGIYVEYKGRMSLGYWEDTYSSVSLNMASWCVHGNIIQRSREFSIAMLDYWSVNQIYACVFMGNMIRFTRFDLGYTMIYHTIPL